MRVRSGGWPSDPEPPRLVLASGSPRRRELLAGLGVPFEVAASSLQEDLEPAAGESPERFAMRLAWEKAMDVSASHPDAMVLGADTIVVLDGQVLGKPADGRQAETMLRALRGKEHQVITGVFLVHAASGLQLGAADETKARFREYTDAEMALYIASGDPLDKAGAYAIQSSSFHPAERIEGCYFTVVGLPLCTVARLLLRAGLDVLLRPGFTVPEDCRRAECGLA